MKLRPTTRQYFGLFVIILFVAAMAVYLTNNQKQEPSKWDQGAIKTESLLSTTATSAVISLAIMKHNDFNMLTLEMPDMPYRRGYVTETSGGLPDKRLDEAFAQIKIIAKLDENEHTLALRNMTYLTTYSNTMKIETNPVVKNMAGDNFAGMFTYDVIKLVESSCPPLLIGPLPSALSAHYDHIIDFDIVTAHRVIQLSLRFDKSTDKYKVCIRE